MRICVTFCSPGSRSVTVRASIDAVRAGSVDDDAVHQALRWNPNRGRPLDPRQGLPSAGTASNSPEGTMKYVEYGCCLLLVALIALIAIAVIGNRRADRRFYRRIVGGRTSAVCLQCQGR